MMKPAQLLPYLAVALATALIVLAGVVTGWHYSPAPDAAALRRELLEGVVPIAAHEQLRERVARQDVIIAELVEGSKEMGASVREAQKSGKIVQSTVDGMGARLLAVEGALSEEGERARRQMQGRRRAQANSGGQGAEQANSAAVTVKQFSIDVLPTHVAIDPAGGKNGHRRTQAAASCKQRDIATRSQAITTACCTEEGEDCSGGLPSNCNADCANELLPFWEDCEAHLGAERAEFEAAVELCRNRTPSLAEQLNVECADGTPAADCVPRCSEEYHGYQLLLNIGGEDSKMSCELHHELYSWIGGASDGGYLGSDFQAFFSAVVSGAAGVYVGMLVEDAGIGTDLVVTPGQSVSVAGDPSLPAPAWGIGGFSVQERGSLALTSILIQGAISVLAGGSASLSGCTLAASATIDLGGGGSLSLASMAVPAAVLRAAENTLNGAGSTLRLDAVAVPEVPNAGTLTGTMAVGIENKSIEPLDFGALPATSAEGAFAVASGPCTISMGGRCVGRPDGYQKNEHCTITVGGGGGGALGPCPVFDTANYNDDVTLSGEERGHYGSDCPEGAALAAGDALNWTSGSSAQGSVGSYNYDNGCAAKGTCGLPYSRLGLGGGWELCFAGGWGCTNPAATNYDPAAAADDGSCVFPQCDDCAPFFIVTSGFTTCTVSEGGRCVGRPGGYRPYEACAITVGGCGGVLGACPVFDTYPRQDPVTLPGGAAHHGSDCPEGAALAPGDAIAWTSNGDRQGSVGSSLDNGCAAKGTCGLPYSGVGLGGGWELCFA